MGLTKEERKLLQEKRMAEMKAEIEASRQKGVAREKNAKLGSLQVEINKDPAGLDRAASRRKNPEGVASSRIPEFNTFLAQLEEPRSFLNLLPEIMKNPVLEVPQEYLNIDEEELLKLLDAKHGYKPTAVIETIRNNFWMEHDRVAATRNEIINLSNIWLGVMTREYFYRIAGGEAPHVLAYILCRPPEYEAVMKGLLNLSTRKIRDVLNIPLQRADGSIQDAKIIELVLKAAAMVDLRARGGYLQRSETKNLTMMKQETTSYTTVFNAVGTTKATDLSALTANIDEKIAALEKEMAAIPGVQAAIEEQLPNKPLEVNYTKVEDVDV